MEGFDFCIPKNSDIAPCVLRAETLQDMIQLEEGRLCIRTSGSSQSVMHGYQRLCVHEGVLPGHAYKES